MLWLVGSWNFGVHFGISWRYSTGVLRDTDFHKLIASNGSNWSRMCILHADRKRYREEGYSFGQKIFQNDLSIYIDLLYSNATHTHTEQLAHIRFLYSRSRSQGSCNDLYPSGLIEIRIWWVPDSLWLWRSICSWVTGDWFQNNVDSGLSAHNTSCMPIRFHSELERGGLGVWDGCRSHSLCFTVLDSYRKIRLGQN